MVMRTDRGFRSLTDDMVLDVVHDTHVPYVEGEGGPSEASGQACTHIN
jgi:hypothetical protein